MSFSRPIRTPYSGDIIDDYDHYDGRGRRIGSSRVDPALVGGPRMVHYDTQGSMTGWSQREDRLLGGERVVHYDVDGAVIGWTVPDVGVVSGTEQWVEYDADGRKIWISRWVTGLGGGARVEHQAVGRSRRAVRSARAGPVRRGELVGALVVVALAVVVLLIVVGGLGPVSVPTFGG